MHYCKMEIGTASLMFQQMHLQLNQIVWAVCVEMIQSIRWLINAYKIRENLLTLT